MNENCNFLELLQKMILQEDVNVMLQRYLGNANKTWSVINFTVEPFSVKQGYLSDQKWIHVEYQDETGVKTVKFFVKSLTKNDTHRKFVESFDGFNREIYVFEKIFRDFELFDKCDFSPRLVFSRQNDFIAFENLDDLGFQGISRGNCLSFDEILVLLSRLAQFHSLSMIYKKKTGKLVDHTNRHVFAEPYYFDDDRVNQVLPPLVGLKFQVDYFFKHENKEELKRKIEKTCLKFPEYVKSHENDEMNVVSHGDLHYGNILVKKDSTGKIVDCRIIDYQSARYVPVGHDFLFVVYFLTNWEFQKQNIEILIEKYYRMLSDNLKRHNLDITKIMLYEEYYENCKYLQPFAVTQASIFHQFLYLSPEYIAQRYKDPEQCEESFGKNIRLPMIKEHLIQGSEKKPKFDDPVYRKRIFESTESLVEFMKQWKD